MADHVMAFNRGIWRDPPSPSFRNKPPNRKFFPHRACAVNLLGRTMRTPLVLLLGLLFVAWGWILDLTTTVAPNWRTIHNISGYPADLVLHQGIWDICRSFTASRDVLCNHEDIEYFNNQIIEVARRMMLASLIVTLIGLCVVTIGTHCWTDKPRWSVGALGGLLIFSSGVLAIIPVAWYHHILTYINSPSSDIRVGYCIVLGYTGGITEVLAGLAMFGGLYQGHYSGKKGEGKVENIGRSDTQAHPKSDGHGSAKRSRASSVPYSLESLKQEVNFWRGTTSSASKTL